ncbi:MAG: helix-turn-helix transcriptional regulator [Clostridia bacterium]|nr:helix-turn-helix transcriptional regulator [Clostridia bacterium]
MHIGFESELYNIAHNITQIPSGSCLIHSHNKYEILYMVEGDAIFSIGGSEFKMQPHTLLFIPPNVFHGIHVLTDAPYDRYTVHFDPTILSHEHRALLLSKLPDKSGASCCVYNMGESGILDMLRQFDDLDGGPQTLHKPLVPIFLHALIARILIKLPDTTGAQDTSVDHNTSHMLKNKLLDYIDDHFTEPITLDTLSAQFFVSKSQLNQVFRQVTGTTIIDYIIRKRIAYAQQLLLNGVSAMQAGVTAGFGDYTSFYRAYKKHFGVSPNHDKREVTHKGSILEESARANYLAEGFDNTLEEKKKKKRKSGE